MLSQLSLDEANRYVAGVIAIEREQQGPFASSVQLYITRILTTLLASEGTLNHTPALRRLLLLLFYAWS
jgi:hypothetical protein